MSRTACCSRTSGTTSTTARRIIVSTGPEIWRETNGKVDGFICAIGTGGTIAGVSTYLRERKRDIVIGVADPRGAAMYDLFTPAKRKPRPAARSRKASGSAASPR